MVVLLVIIYLAFISLGLPDSLLGSAWPAMYEGFGVSISSAGIISMVVAGGTIISSLLSDRLIRRFGTGHITLVSVCMTAVALLGISLSDSFIAVCLWAIPLGLGAGSVDAALNNFVALHYKAAHMNWLHSFWGIGTIIGPLIISSILMQSGTWNSAYRLISILQFALVAILIFSLPLWKKAGGFKTAENPAQEASQKAPAGIRKAIGLPKAKPTLIAFFCYSSVEQTVILWGSSYLVVVRGIQEDIAAGWISLFFIGITLGRILSGFLSMKLSQKQLIRLGQLLIAVGIAILFLPWGGTLMIVALFLIGLGCAPIFPSMLHETPNTFGKVNSQALMGIQMACAYLGTTLMPPLFGLLAGKTGYEAFPFYLGVFLILMVLMVNRIYAKRKTDIRI
ncbi:MFS transporter [Christensenella timonensis]|uniref:MFS transporter n=1 Tax=Christensenella timonensis TaxID=1816678 RepID=UPI00082C12D4|nr:MFS transporter [Christensenella timonensis]